jgi:peptidoglycan/xylan/chitin deacetylase (PgdA/CDA1 family)
MAKGKGIWKTLKRSLNPRGFILMYHQISPSSYDPFDLSVDPANFEEQMAILAANCTLVPIDMIQQAVRARVPFPVAISFDDGYENNFSLALPILEKYKIPATFFITTGHFAHGNLFWWDILEKCFFDTDLPGNIHLTDELVTLELDLVGEEVLTEDLKSCHRHWKYQSPATTKRSSSFLEVWNTLKNLPDHSRESLLQQLILTTGMSLPTSIRMTRDQIRQVADSDLFSIGGHSAYHNPLSQLSEHEQVNEISRSLIFLENICGRPLNSFAYPYGSYNETTVEILKNLQIKVAVTTTPSRVTVHSSSLELPRMKVSNLNGFLFREAFHFIHESFY